MLIVATRQQHLRLAHPRPAHDPALWLESGAPLAEAPAPRVLCAELTRRLALLNAAVRRLRAMGVRVAEQSLVGHAAGGAPWVRIERDPAKSLAPLLDASAPRRWVRSAAGVAIARTVFMGVSVTWEERA